MISRCQFLSAVVSVLVPPPMVNEKHRTIPYGPPGTHRAKNTKREIRPPRTTSSASSARLTNTFRWCPTTKFLGPCNTRWGTMKDCARCEISRFLDAKTLHPCHLREQPTVRYMDTCSTLSSHRQRYSATAGLV